MKVKIAYTVDFEDIPREVDSILLRAHTFAHDAVLLMKEIKTNETGNSIDDSLSVIDKIRKQLSTSDLALADCDAILRGYLETKLQLDAPSDAEEE